MTVYPGALDDDSTIIRIDDNLSELGTAAINQARAAIFALERELGINPSGSVSSVATRFDVAHNADGSIKSSALTSVGLATLPIVDNQVASSAGIKETKLSLDFSTGDLNTLITANSSILTTLAAFTTTINSNLLIHINGGVTLSDGSTAARHVASHIDLNAVTTDPRDTSFSWTGLIDKDGADRTATTVATGLLQINNALTTHENLTASAHPATAITVNTDNFTELPSTATNVQTVINALDDTDRLQIGVHRAIQHSNGVPPTARSEDLVLDGYSQNIVPVTQVAAFLLDPPATSPVDNNNNGDDLIKFLPTNTGFLFDSQFAQVKIGDVIRVNYGGVEASYGIESLRHVPGLEWFIRLNGSNLFNRDGYDGYAFARIDRPLFDDNTRGVLAVAAANNDLDPTILSSVVVAHPRSASVVGIGFNANKLDAIHYKLYLQLYPSGDPTEKIISLPAIDVTGNAGITPGKYTLASVIATTNDALRAAGFNYRFIAFEHQGEFGIMLSDPIDKASFSIVNGTLSGATLGIGIFTENVIGDALDGLDAFGFGASAAAIASPSFTSSFSSSTAALQPTKVIVPLKRRNYIVNGVRRDDLAAAPMTISDGYWLGTITARTVIAATTVETEYTVPLDLSAAELKAGKTITIQPTVGFTDASYLDADYGRFIIKSVAFPKSCPTDTVTSTVIRVISGIHGAGTPIASSSSPSISVRLYFSEDSVSFNNLHLSDPISAGTTYNRFHEIYVDDAGKTFSHERARMPKQVGTVALIDTTDRWTIKDVSSKLRGFSDSTGLRKFVRFYILSYDSASSEFDGYLGEPDSGDGIFNTGEVITSRKNVTNRFFDNTNIDFIELEFNDEDVSPGNDILPTNSPRYVDIEIFSTLARDDEFMRIASCELDGQEVQCVIDRREFGSISEKDFTDSAVDFISTGDRFLHENGVLKGLSFDIAGTDDRELFFNGGIALVNGKVVTTNNSSVVIPEVAETGAVLPDIITWAVCINESGQFVPIIITPTKQQFFAVKPSGGANYYVQSVTFDELIATRKDLTLISIVTATIASITLSETDARRFIGDGVTGFSLTSDNGLFVGSFVSLAAVAQWVKNSNAGGFVIEIRGGSITTDLTELSDFGGKSVVFDGRNYKSSGDTFTFSSAITLDDNLKFIGINFNSSNSVTSGNDCVFTDCEFTFSGRRGLGLSSGISVKGCSFDYIPTGLTLASSNNINMLADLAGCIFINEISVTKAVVEDCEFSTSSYDNATLRVPYIACLLDNDNIVEGLRIVNNRFLDNTAHAFNAAIAILANDNVAGAGALLANSVISGNYCDQEQGIHLTTNNTFVSAGSAGLSSINNIIENNNCGMIGHMLSAEVEDIAVSTGLNKINGIKISGNTCKAIMPVDNTGRFDFGSFTFRPSALPETVIDSNYCSWISVLVHSSSHVTNNTLQAQAAASSHSPDPLETAILPIGTREGASCVVSNNTVRAGGFDATTHTYALGIFANIIDNLIIKGNTIEGIAPATSITTAPIVIGDTSTTAPKLIVQGNMLARGTSVVDAYILVTGDDSVTGIISDNVFDGYTIDDVTTPPGTFDTGDVILFSSSPKPSVVAERNINQTVTIKPGVMFGNFAVNDVVSGDTGVSSIIGASRKVFDDGLPGVSTEAVFHYISTDAEIIFTWDVSLADLLPLNSNVVSISLGVGLFITPPTITGDFQADIYSPATGSSVANDSIDLKSVSSKQITLLPNPPVSVVNSLFVINCTYNSSATTNVKVSTDDSGLEFLTFTYRW